MTNQANHPKTVAAAAQGDFFDFSEITTLAELSFTTRNSVALSQQTGELDEAPSGMAMEPKQDRAMMAALEQVLDGVYNAVDGFTYVSGGRTMRFNGLKDNITFCIGRLEQEHAKGTAFVVIEGQKPQLSETGQRWFKGAETAKMTADHLMEMAKIAEQAYLVASMGEPYQSRSERIAARQEKKAAAETTRGEFTAMLAGLGFNL